LAKKLISAAAGLLIDKLPTTPTAGTITITAAAIAPRRRRRADRVGVRSAAYSPILKQVV